MRCWTVSSQTLLVLLLPGGGSVATQQAPVSALCTLPAGNSVGNYRPVKVRSIMTDERALLMAIFLPRPKSIQMIYWTIFRTYCLGLLTSIFRNNVRLWSRPSDWKTQLENTQRYKYTWYTNSNWIVYLWLKPVTKTCQVLMLHVSTAQRKLECR